MSAINDDDESVVHLYHFEALQVLNSSLRDNHRVERTALSREISDQVVTYIENCQRYKNDVAARNANKTIANFNEAGTVDNFDDIHGAHPILSHMEAYQIISLGLFTLEKAFLVQSIRERFTNHKDDLQILLDELASLAQ